MLSSVKISVRPFFCLLLPRPARVFIDRHYFFGSFLSCSNFSLKNSSVGLTSSISIVFSDLDILTNLTTMLPRPVGSL